MTSSKATGKGNQPKRLSFREAWERIGNAREEGFYLEAITIEESIICDRLLSHLAGVGAVTCTPSTLHKISLGSLVKTMKEYHPHPIVVKGYENLQQAIDDWRKKRNECIHALAKSLPGQATTPVGVFLKMAKDTADEGNRLARAVSNWHRSQLRESAKSR